MSNEGFGSPEGKEISEDIESMTNTRFFTTDKKRRSTNLKSFQTGTPKQRNDSAFKTTYMDEKKKREVIKSKPFIKFFDKASKILEKGINSDDFFVLEEIIEEDNMDADLDNVP